MWIPHLIALQSQQCREAVTREGNDSISEVLFRQHTRPANTV
jgi:hypothetical protein